MAASMLAGHPQASKQRERPKERQYQELLQDERRSVAMREE